MRRPCTRPLPAIGQALYWQQKILYARVDAHNGETAEREELERFTLTRLLPMALLAANIIELRALGLARDRIFPDIVPICQPFERHNQPGQWKPVWGR